MLRKIAAEKVNKFNMKQHGDSWEAFNMLVARMNEVFKICEQKGVIKVKHDTWKEDMEQLGEENDKEKEDKAYIE